MISGYDWPFCYFSLGLVETLYSVSQNTIEFWSFLYYFLGSERYMDLKQKL